MRPKWVLWASFFLNGLSFFFSVRPIYAAPLFAAFAAVAFAGYSLFGTDLLAPIVEVALVILFLFAPVVLNAVFLLIHESGLKHATGGKATKIADLVGEVAEFFS